MNEHVEPGRVPFFANGPAAISRPGEPDRGNDWPLVAVFFAGVIVSYAVGIGAVYLALTTLL
jgi:hypothetical protein